LKRKIIFYKTYFIDFYLGINSKDQEKVEYVLDMVRNLSWVPVKFLKHLEGTDGLYEIRGKSGGATFRVVCFFDSGNLVILLHGFLKKSMKTPKKEIRLAEKLMKEYFLKKAHDKNRKETAE
jgi:phage-related protein